MMKRLFAFLLLSVSAFATTTVTGTIQNLGTVPIGSNSFVRFWLRGCGGNQPRIAGIALIGPSQGGVFYIDLPASSSGVISGTIDSTRDATGLLGGDIECGGSTTAVWYGMQTFVNGKGGPEIPIHAKNGSTFDISTVTPITTNPVTTSPSGDTTYLRLDGGNGPMLGSITPSGNGTLNLGSVANGWNAFLKALTVSGAATFSGASIFSGTASFPGNITGNTVLTGNETFDGQVTAGVVNGVYNAGACAAAAPPSWCSGSELGAWVNAAFTACSLNCTVYIPAGFYTYTTTISMTKTGESLVGAGSYATILYYTGSSDGIKWQMNPFSVAKAGAMKGFSLIGTSSATNCIHSGSLEGSTWDDLMIGGCTGASAVGILLENANIGGSQAWTERTFMKNVFVGTTPLSAACGSGNCFQNLGNTNGIELLVNGGTNSFGYSSIEAWLNVETGQVGFNIPTGSQVYHSTIRLKGNMDTGNASTAFLGVGGNLINGELSVVAEGPSGITNAIHVSSTGEVCGELGTVQFIASGNPSTGGIQPVQVDVGGVYNVSPWTTLAYPASQGCPSSNMNILLTTSLTTTAAASDNVTINGALSTSRCFLTPTNASAATNIASTYIGTKTTNQITVNHSVTAGMTYDIGCTPGP